MRLYDRVRAYDSRTPSENVEALRTDLQDPSFNRLVEATFNGAKYFLKPEAFQKYVEKHKPGFEFNEVNSLTPESRTYTTLERMASGELSGNQAKAALMEDFLLLTPGDQELVLMILEKTWRNGVTVNLINQARPGSFRPIKLMLAKKFNELQAKGKPGKIQWPRVSTVKYDGFRGAFFSTTGRCLSRLGNPFFLQPELLQAMTRLVAELEGWGYQAGALDGELFAGSWKDTAEARASDKGYDHFVVFSTMPEGCAYGEDLDSTLDVLSFFRTVEELIQNAGLEQHLSVPIHKVVNNADEEREFFQQQLEAGWEGTVSRPLVHPYISGRSDAWLKNKAEEYEDLPITGAIEADPRSRNAGKVGAVLVSRKGIESGCHGMSDYLRDRITEMGDSIIGLIAEVQYHELTPDGLLRHGVIKNIRFDKGEDS